MTAFGNLSIPNLPTMPVSKKTIYIDMDNVLIDCPSAFHILDEDTRQQYEGHLVDVPGIYCMMNPVPGAIETFNQLAEKHDVYILSHVPWDNPSIWPDKLKWVKRYLGEKAFKHLILTDHKKLNHGDILIDIQFDDADPFNGEVILLGSDRFKDWNKIREYLFENHLME